MAYLIWSEKDPNDIEDRFLDWTARLSEAGDTITTVAWTVSPTGQLALGAQSNTTTHAYVWLSGGTAGVTYLVTCRITTAGGRTLDQTVKIKVKEH